MALDITDVHNNKSLFISPHLISMIFRIERSTDQVIKPVNLEALSRWVGHIPTDVLKDMDNVAPMLKRLGYDPNANPPDYGQPDPEVIHNTERVCDGVHVPWLTVGTIAVFFNVFILHFKNAQFSCLILQVLKGDVKPPASLKRPSQESIT